MKMRERIALLVAALTLVAVVGCTNPSGGSSGPGVTGQPAASTQPSSGGGKGDY
jgi:hypothetical protein